MRKKRLIKESKIQNSDIQVLLSSMSVLLTNHEGLARDISALARDFGQLNPRLRTQRLTGNSGMASMRHRRHGDCASLKCEQTHSTVSMHFVKEETGKKASPTTWPNAWTTRQTTWAPKDEVTSDYVTFNTRNPSYLIIAAMIALSDTTTDEIT